MQKDLRTAVEIDLTDAQKQTATNNKAEFDKDKSAFIYSMGDGEMRIIIRI